MKKLVSAVIASLLVVSFNSFAAPADASTCEAKAVSKDGKPLAGAAKASFIKKCESDAGGNAKSSCEAKAVSKDGKPLAGAAKTASMKKCMKDAK